MVQGKPFRICGMAAMQLRHGYMRHPVGASFLQLLTLAIGEDFLGHEVPEGRNPL